MKTIYAIDFLEDKFFTVEIPVLSENDTMYFLDYDRLTYEQKYATDWNIVVDKDKEGTYNWTTDKDNFNQIKENFIKNKISQLQEDVNYANSILNNAVASAYELGVNR